MKTSDLKKLWIIPVALAAGNAVYQLNRKHPGDSERYLPEFSEERNTSLKGKNIIFLGSSVTYGRKDVSFVEYLNKQYGVNTVKEALSGTTLVDEKVYGRDSYITRMKRINKNLKPDLFICQLSTNDASLKKPMGRLSDSYNKELLDTHTVCGAIEYIIAYARETWNCPIMFYTNTEFKSEQYRKMVGLLLRICDKWNIGIIDLYHDLKVNDISSDRYKLYTINPIHPSLAGYRDWWTPYMAVKIEEYLQEKKDA